MIGSVCDHELGRSDALRKCERAPRDKRRAAHLGRRAAGCGCRIGMQHDFRIKHLKKRAKIAFPRSDKRCFREFTLAGHITIGLKMLCARDAGGHGLRVFLRQWACGRLSGLRDRSVSKQTRTTTVVNQPAMFWTPLSSERLSRSRGGQLSEPSFQTSELLRQ
jgi:hypothetical protein